MRTQQPIEQLKQMIKSKKYISDMPVYEASEFWDDHEFSGFDDVQEVHDLQFPLRKKKGVFWY